MSLFDFIFGTTPKYPVFESPLFTSIERPQMTGKDLEYARRALALHPDAYPEFNLQPTIDMLRLADSYGLEVRRKPDQP